jgi:hypothetical protein
VWGSAVEGTYTLSAPTFNPNECGMTANNAPDEAFIGALDTLGLAMSAGFLSPALEPVVSQNSAEVSLHRSIKPAPEREGRMRWDACTATRSTRRG